MKHLQKKFKIVINGICSPELLLWQPIFKNFLARYKEHICTFQTALSDSDSNYLRDQLGITNLDAIEMIQEDTEEKLILFLCLANQIPSGFNAKDGQEACCFFGGMSSSNLSEQLDSARKRKITTLYSDLLPCEIKNSIPPENFDFFKEVYEFLPHAHNETTIETNSHLKSKVLYVRGKISLTTTNALAEKTLLSTLSQKEEFKVLDLSNTDLSEWISRVWPGKNYIKIIVGDISIPLQHLLLDICRLKSIELQYFFNQSFPSSQRRYLNNNPLFESVLATVSSTSSLRKKVFDILNFSNSSSAVKQEANHETMLKYPSSKMVDATEPFCPRKLFTDKEGKLEYFREVEHAACEMAFGSSENSFRLNHPYSALDMDEDINSRVIHTLVFLEASTRVHASKSSYAISPLIMHRCMHHCLFSGKTSTLQVLPSLFRLAPITFVEAIIDIHQKTRDENKKLAIVNQILTTFAILEIDHDLKVELYEKFRKSAISILLDLFIHLDLNENEEFLALAKKAKLGINIIYPLVYYFGTKPRDGGLNSEEIEQIFKAELQNAYNTKLLVITTISKQLAYQEVTSLEYFEGLDSRFSHLFEKCSKSLFQYAYLSSINGNSLDKRVLNKFNSANAPYDKLLIICASILLGNDQVITDQLDSLTEESTMDFFASGLDVRIKLQCLILIRHYFEIGPINDSAIHLFKSYDFRHSDLFLKLVSNLPFQKKEIEPQVKSILSRIANAVTKYAS